MWYDVMLMSKLICLMWPNKVDIDNLGEHKWFKFFPRSKCHKNMIIVATPLLEKCEDDTHTLEMGTWESSRTPEISKFNCKGQNTSPWGIPYIVGKLSKCRCQKWPCMSHLDICSTSYGKKKGRELNCQFDFWPLKVGNRPDPGV